MAKTVKGLSLLAFISLCFVNFAYMSDMVVIPAFGLMSEAFADAPQAVVAFIISGPQLIACIAALLATIWMSHFAKKRILVVVFAIFTVAACLGGIVDNPYYVAVMRAIVGFCGGTVSPVALSLINDAYRDDEDRKGSYVGYFQSFGTGMAIVTSLVSGVVCLGGWQNAFFVYYAAIPMLVLVALFVPNVPSVDTDESAKVEKSDERMPWGRMVGVIVVVVLMSISINILSYMQSIFVSQTGIGDSAFAGLMSSSMTIATTVFCLFFGLLNKHLKRFMPVFIWVLVAISYVCFIFADGPVLAIAGMVFIGGAYGMLMSYYCVYVGTFVPPTRVSSAIAIVTGTIGLGAFLSSYVTYFIMGIMESELISAVFPFVLVLAIAGIVVETILALRSRVVAKKQG